MKNKKYIFDLDGVIRNLLKGIDPYKEEPSEWVVNFEGGLSFSEVINKNLNILINAPTTKYYGVIFEYAIRCPITILTSQEYNWREKTTEWVYSKFQKNMIKDIIFVEHFVSKENFLRKNTNYFIIEDYPFFSEDIVDRIYLIEREYNKNSKQYLENNRIRSPKELRKVLFG